MYEALTKLEAQRWKEMVITPSREAGLVASAAQIHAHKSTYVAVEDKLRSLSLYVPWWAIGVIHLREANLNFGCQLAQGDPLEFVSRHVPRGRGPFLGADAFLRGCLDALIDCAPHAAHWSDWSPGGTAVLFELYNGLGYANKGIPSPYNWGGTDQYIRGKYVSDGVFSATTVDTQPGCMPVVKCIMEADPSAKFGPPMTALPAPPHPAMNAAPHPAPVIIPARPAPAGFWGKIGEWFNAPTHS